MAKFKHMPEHPYANERGMIEVNDLYFEGLYLMGAMGEDKRMMRGNEPVVVNYISDHMPPLVHMALPRGSPPIDSKSKFRKVTKEQGCVEVGNETTARPRQRTPLDKRKRREDIRRAWNQVRDGNSQSVFEHNNSPRLKYKPD